MNRLRTSLGAVLMVGGLAGGLRAEPMFLSRQYARCTTCHYSPTGGGLLTPYGRSLSHNELSSFKGTSTSQEAGREESFLYGLLGDTLGKVHVGIDLRPARLEVDFLGMNFDRTFFMNADLVAAFRDGGWTVYGQVGREPLPQGGRLKSYEYWVSHESEKGWGVRAGRFLPAYGVRLADHTAFTRRGLGLDVYDQIYGVELSHLTQKHLLQVAAGPGRADSILDDREDGAFTAAARFQRDVGTRTVLVASGLYRGAAGATPRAGAVGLAAGFAPVSRLSVWNEANARFEQGVGGPPGYTLLNETALEVYRGVWIKVSPQLATVPGDSSAGVFRWMLGAIVLPRTHYNLDVSYYRDRDRVSDAVSKTWLFQFHMYL